MAPLKITPRFRRWIPWTVALWIYSIPIVILAGTATATSSEGQSPFSQRSRHSSDPAPLLERSESMPIYPEQIEAWFIESSNADWTAEIVRDLPKAELHLSEITIPRRPGWRRVDVENPGDQHLERILKITPPHFDSLEMAMFDSRGNKIAAGTFKPGEVGANGTLPAPMPLFRTRIPPGGATFVFKTQGYGSEQVTLRIETIEESLDNLSREHIIYGGYAGLILALLTYSLFLYFAIKERFILYHLTFLVSLLGLTGAINGYFPYLAASPIYFSKWIGPFAHGALISGTLFARSFLKTGSLAPILDKYHRTIVALSAVFAFISFTPIDRHLVQWTSKGLELLIATQSVMILLTAALIAARGYRPALLYLFGVTCSLIGVGVILLSYRGLIRDNIWTRFSLQMSSTVEMVLMTVVIGIRLRQINRSNQILHRERNSRERLRALTSVLIHDFASPLNAIQLQATFSAQGGPENWGLVSDAADDQGRILSFVESELHKEKFQLNGLEDNQVANLQELPDAISRLLVAAAEKKGIPLQLPKPDDLAGLYLKGSLSVLTHSILGNLLSNSLKFTSPPNKVTLNVVKVRGNKVQFRITDEGVGIPDRILTQIESGITGTAIHRAGTAAEPGTGNGLAIAFALVRQFQGTVELQSNTSAGIFRKQGTQIRITLPLLSPTHVPAKGRMVSAT